MSALPPFDGNSYRKRILAAVDARGGPEQSDPFEIYDLPVTDVETLSDAAVAAQIDAVWAFWQKQREHPKYRGVVTAMLAIHRGGIADQMRTRDGRRWLAAQTVADRSRRDEERYAELDAAIRRLVERFGGIPEDKLDGLRRFALAAGVDEAAFAARVRRHRVVRVQRPAPAASDLGVYRQVRADLEELGQLDGTAPAASLYDLLGLPSGADRQRVRERRDALAARNRELRPNRRRALVDDLLAAVTALLVNGDPDRYLDSVRSDVLTRLRPRVAAAVLVEDELTADDHAHLLREAQAAGLDRDRAVSVLAQLAAELGVPVRISRAGNRSATPNVGTSAAAATPGSVWQQELSQARTALREGFVLAAKRHVSAALAAAAGMLPPIRAVRDEVDAILADADQRWRTAASAVAARRYAEATAALDRLVAVARDVPGPQGQSAQELMAQVTARLAEAAAALAAALQMSGAERELALLDVLVAAPDHEPTRAALTAAGVAPATEVRFDVGPDGTLVSWRASRSPGRVDYRVLRVGADGGTRPVGVTRNTSLEDGAPGVAAGYVVIARRAGIAAPEARTGSASPAAPTGVQPIPTLALTPHGRRLRLAFSPPRSGRAEVRRLAAGVVPPALGSVVDNPEALGVPVPSMGPGLAVDARPSTPICEYVVLTEDGPVVAGASAAYVELPAVDDLQVTDGRLRWTWPPACTEVVVLYRADAPPVGSEDPQATRRKLTNTRYEIDGGLALPDSPVHVAVFSCVRRGSRLFVATEAPSTARILIA